MTALPRDSRDHAGWLAYWGEQLVRSIAEAIAHPPGDGTTASEDYRLRYAINCARIAHGRAVKVRPRLKKP